MMRYRGSRAASPIQTHSSFPLMLAAAGLLSLLAAAAQHGFAAEPLRVCLQSDDPPLSSRDSGTGFDVALSRAIAERLGRPLAIQWFVTRKDPDSNPPREASALLSDNRCQLVGEYPLMTGTLGHLDGATGKLPPFAGRTAEDRRRSISLHDLVPTAPYRFDALGIVLSPSHAGMAVRRLADLAGLRLGVEIHTVPDLIAMQYEQGRLAERVAHFTDPAPLFGALEAGRIDAALVDLHELDAWRAARPNTRIARSGYTHSIGFNMAFVGIAREQPLIAQVDAVLSDLLRGDELRLIAERSGLTWLPPRSPAIAPSVPLAAFAGD
jgi:ABC-type amino acid transport substrate-binding protein